MNTLSFSIIALAQIFMTINQTSQTSAGDQAIGVWQSARKDSKLEIFKSGNKYYGKLVVGWGIEIYQADGKTLAKDTKNPDAKLRNRTLSNLVIASDLTYADGEYTGGTLYDARSGRTFSFQMKITNGQLKTRAFWKFNMLGMNTNWTRIQ